MSKASPYNVKVDVDVQYMPEHSEPDNERFVFTYHITIRNEGDVAAQLLTRHWLITDANSKVQEVRGEGVIGEQPHLEPGEGFSYTSATMIETPVGSMQGSYQMMADDGKTFDAEIAAFSLSRPGMLH